MNFVLDWQTTKQTPPQLKNLLAIVFDQELNKKIMILVRYHYRELEVPELQKVFYELVSDSHTKIWWFNQIECWALLPEIQDKEKSI